MLSCFTPSCASFSFKDAGDTLRLHRFLQTPSQGSCNAPCHVNVFSLVTSVTDSSYGKHSPLCDTTNHINFTVLWFLIVISVSRKPLLTTINVAILNLKKKKNSLMELNEFSNPKLPSAINLCFDTEIKPHSCYARGISTRALWACAQSLIVRCSWFYTGRAIAHEEHYQPWASFAFEGKRKEKPIHIIKKPRSQLFLKHWYCDRSQKRHKCSCTARQGQAREMPYAPSPSPRLTYSLSSPTFSISNSMVYLLDLSSIKYTADLQASCSIHGMSSTQ